MRKLSQDVFIISHFTWDVKFFSKLPDDDLCVQRIGCKRLRLVTLFTPIAPHVQLQELIVRKSLSDRLLEHMLFQLGFFDKVIEIRLISKRRQSPVVWKYQIVHVERL